MDFGMVLAYEVFVDPSYSLVYVRGWIPIILKRSRVNDHPPGSSSGILLNVGALSSLWSDEQANIPTAHPS